MPVSLKSKLYPAVVFWLPVVLCMAFIFSVSCLPQPAIARLFAFQDIAFHLLAYSVLAALFLRALRNTCTRIKAVSAAALSIVFCVLYGASDEFHQSFIPGRYSSGIDVLIDGIGSVIGSLIYSAVKPELLKGNNWQE